MLLDKTFAKSMKNVSGILGLGNLNLRFSLKVINNLF